MKTVFTEKAPKVVGPYSQAVVVDKLVFCSGQIGLVPEMGNMAEGIEAQTRQVLANLEAVIKEAGSSMEKVVKTTVYLKNMADYSVFNDIYADFFKGLKPARATIQVASLPRDALVEIEAVAVIS